VTPVANAQSDPSPLVPFPSAFQIQPVAVDCSGLSASSALTREHCENLIDGTAPGADTVVALHAGDFMTFDLGAKYTLTEVQTNMYCNKNIPCTTAGCSGNVWNVGHQLDAVKLFTSNDGLTWDLWFSASDIYNDADELGSPCDIVKLNPLPTRARHLRFLVPQLAGGWLNAVIQQIGIFAKMSTFGSARITVSSAPNVVDQYPLVKPNFPSLLPSRDFGPSFDVSQECDNTMKQDACWCSEFSMRCPKGWTRQGDGSGCFAPNGVESCDLGWCSGHPNAGYVKCPEAATDLGGFQCSGRLGSSTMPCSGLIDGTPSATDYVCMESGGYVQLRLNERLTLSRVHVQNFCDGSGNPLYDIDRIRVETSDDGWLWTVQVETVNLLEAGIEENCKTIDLRLFMTVQARYIRISAWAHPSNALGASFCIHSIDAFGGLPLPPTPQIDGGSLEWTPQDFFTGLPLLNRLGGARPLSPSTFNCNDTSAGSCSELFDGLPNDRAQFDALYKFVPAADGGSGFFAGYVCLRDGGSVAQHFDEPVLLSGLAYEAYCNNENHHFGEFNISVSSDETGGLWKQVLAVDFGGNQTAHDMLSCDAFQFTLDQPVLAKSVKMTVRSAVENSQDTGHVASPAGYDHACLHEIAFYGTPRPSSAGVQATTEFFTPTEKKLFVSDVCRFDVSSQVLSQWCAFRDEL